MNNVISEINPGEFVYANLENLVFTKELECIDTTKVYIRISCCYGADTAPRGQILNNYHNQYNVNFYEDGKELFEYRRGDRTIRFRKDRPRGLFGIIHGRKETFETHISDDNIINGVADFLNKFMID